MMTMKSPSELPFSTDSELEIIRGVEGSAMNCEKCEKKFTEVGPNAKSPRRENLCRSCDSVSIDEWELLIEKIHLQQKALESRSWSVV